MKRDIVMSNNIHFSSFPVNELQALAILYVQNQDLTGKSPTDIYNLYRTTYDEMCNEKEKQRQAKLSQM
jgi:hypothetical protein